MARETLHKKNIFISDWCLQDDSVKKKILNLDYEICSYHYNHNQKKLKSDWAYLNDLYERVMIALTLKLNEYHKKIQQTQNKEHNKNTKSNHNKSMSALLGPWVGGYVPQGLTILSMLVLHFLASLLLLFLTFCSYMCVKSMGLMRCHNYRRIDLQGLPGELLGMVLGGI